MLKNTFQAYGAMTKIVHWLVAVVVLGLFALGLWMVDLTYYDEWYRSAPHYHKSIGILLAVVMIFRTVWRLCNVRPEVPIEHTLFEKKAAHSAHIILYVMIFLMVLTGYLISTADNRGIEVFNWFEVASLGSFFENQEDIAGDIHRWLAYGLIGLVSVHSIAALKHHFIDKDNTLKRML